ncbi:MAG: hypothetical protein A2076_03825 [Geobacteraceae bacterium GWC2_53_11]|nr:MAG: hypothetical protein A2076_03825 [Geobacteraceae bacterium GWC2_53_11]
MNQNKRFAIVCAVVLMTVVGALPIVVVAETIVTVGGTGSALGTMKQLAGLYEKTHPGVRIRILPSLGSTAGIKAVLDGGINLGVASRPLKQNEQQQGAVAVEYARSPFVFITNATSSKKDITVPELERIYTDPAPHWPDGSRIRLILRPEKDIDTSMVRSLSPAMEQAMKAVHARPGMIQAISDQESTDAVVKTPGALGCATLSEIISEKRPVNILTFNGVKPDVKNIANGIYPLFKSMYVVIAPKTPPVARDFAAFVNSRLAGRILSATGNLPVTTKQGK